MIRLPDVLNRYPRTGVLVASLAIWTGTARGDVALRIEQARPAPFENAAGSIVAESLEDSDGAEPRRFEVTIPGTTRVPLTSGAWRLRLEADHFWAREHIETVSQDNSLTIEAWPTGELVGRLATNADRDAEPSQLPSERPEFLLVRFKSSDYRSLDREPEGMVVCPLSEAAFRCRLPAGALDLQVEAKGHIPHFFWDFEVRTAKRADLGELSLKVGASVSGWVESEERVKVAGASVALSPFLLEAPAQARKRDQIDHLHRSARTDKNGFFMFAGIKPGQYVISATKEGFATSKATVEVEAGRHTTIADPPLILSEPQVLEIFIDPPSPSPDRQWFLAFYRIDRGRRAIEEIVRSPVDWTGVWKSPELATGTYRLVIGTSAGDRWYAEEIEVDRTTSSHFVSIPVVAVRGSLSLGEEPLAAELIFGGASGSVSVTLEADQEGSFSGALPHEGAWDIDIKSREREVAISLEGIEVRRRSGKSYAELELRLSATRLKVSTVDVLGNPLRTLITVRSLDEVGGPLARRGSKIDGVAEFSGLPSGRAEIHATARRETPTGEEALLAQPVEVVLTEDEAEEVELILRPMKKIAGRVVSGGFGISGATVLVIPMSSNTLFAADVATDLEGKFEQEISADVEQAILVVSAPGYCLRILGERVSEGPIALELQSGCGELVVRLPDGTDDLPAASREFQVVHDQGAIALSFLFQWRLLHDRGPIEPPFVSIPRMDPGDYKICRASAAEVLGGLLATGNLPCASGYLPLGSSLELAAPAR